MRERHLAQHPHDDKDDRAGDDVRENRRRACGDDGRAAADEQPGADHATDRDHRDVARQQRSAELVRLAGCRGFEGGIHGFGMG
jgi:hypothetical protein